MPEGKPPRHLLGGVVDGHVVTVEIPVVVEVDHRVVLVGTRVELDICPQEKHQRVKFTQTKHGN